MTFNGEHPIPGHLGQLFVVLAFGSALLATISYYFASTVKDETQQSWKRLARIGFYTNTVSTIGIGVCLFYIIFNHLFEYYYAWDHSSRSLPVYYMISCFWEGQEGSFWLWAFWQAVLGNVLVRRAKSWESPVMAVIMLAQTLLASMLLGVELFGYRVGSSPFILLREALNLKESTPIFATNPEFYKNYLTYITDGNGLNPLLQNYWMVIHPPTLFLGFGSMIVPFAYAIAGLWQKRYKEWIAPAISYALFATMVLGTGIIMGAFWAYESLTFGGFWAWDPVENASLIPWLVLVGALHVLIVYKNTGHSYITATILILTSYVLVLYASFLTRSGILSNSVHAFTDAGMFWHLVVDVVIFLALGTAVIIWRWKELPSTQKDEETYSREFWMFVGAVFLCLSCFHLVAFTSIDVVNAVFHTHIAPPTDPVKHFNTVQASFAVVVTFLTGVTQFMKYKKTDVGRFFITSAVYLGLAILISALLAYITGVYKLNTVFVLIMIGAIYSILANVKVFIDSVKGSFKLVGSAVAHIGFGLIMVGALISAGTSKVISENTTGEQYGADFAAGKNDPRENILMYKNSPMQMGKYLVTYVGDSVSAPNHYFKVDYKVMDASGKVKEEFMLKPNAQANRKMGLVSSPDTKHYLFGDLYTHVNMSNAITYDEDAQANGHDEAEDDKKYDAPIAYQVSVGDTLPFRDGYVLLKGISKVEHIENIPLLKGDMAIAANLEVVTHDRKYTAEPVYLLRGNNAFDFAKKVDDAGLKFRFTKVTPQQAKKFEITLYQQPAAKRKFIVMRAIQFPDINLLWSGTIIMVIGILLSIFRRNKELKTT